MLMPAKKMSKCRHKSKSGSKHGIEVGSWSKAQGRAKVTLAPVPRARSRTGSRFWSWSTSGLWSRFKSRSGTRSGMPIPYLWSMSG